MESDQLTVLDASAAKQGTQVFHKTFPPITRHALAMYCGGSGDHNPIHVDSDFAKASGYPDVFVHGMLVMAYLGRSLTDTVSASAVRSYSVRFVAVTQVHSEITCEGVVTEVFEEGGERLARVSLLAKDQAEQVKLRGEAVVRLN
jgi:acyl dehydratase